jgi:hypothetical protein
MLLEKFFAFLAVVGKKYTGTHAAPARPDMC